MDVMNRTSALYVFKSLRQSALIPVNHRQKGRVLAHGKQICGPN
ncbi:hypothetical protein P9D34_17485 [Bacillus swezeyi]|nr:hypothetical protein [Bacillus swezeyi]MEC1262174.1 hypothetical protein [Bacillus swezeyi]MED2927258.1 hypothetical protein [Bacillus swezeyi]MED2962456.1 hypothetical protein [Bacillus swezeyi]MED3072089.1 hypothetical protein [Bacillus swezeyi]MED3082627.1 hypothetical protein [Bacillus swezeyi]